MWFSLGRWKRGREAEKEGGKGWIPLRPSQGNQWRLAKSMDFHPHPAVMRIPSRTYMSVSVNRANEEPGFLYSPGGTPPSSPAGGMFINTHEMTKSKTQENRLVVSRG